jgi:hypothetical protein
MRRMALLDRERAVRSEAARIASAFNGAGDGTRNEAELWGLTDKELADIERSLEELL